jgi:hypothetical protein
MHFDHLDELYPSVLFGTKVQEQDIYRSFCYVGPDVVIISMPTKNNKYDMINGP